MKETTTSRAAELVGWILLVCGFVLAAGPLIRLQWLTGHDWLFSTMLVAQAWHAWAEGQFPPA